MVFKDYDNKITYSLNKDNSVSELCGWQSDDLTTILPLSSDPADVRKAALKYWDYLMYRGKEVEFSTPFRFERFLSVIRIYRDVFLLYDENTKSWILTRIIIP